MEPRSHSPDADAGSLILRRLLIAMIGALYATCLIWTYQELSKLWSYIGFWYQPPEAPLISLTIVASGVLGLLLPARSWTIVGFAKWVLYFILFIPALVIPLQQGVLPSDELLLLEVLIWISAAAMILFLPEGEPFPPIRLPARLLWQGVMACWLAGNAAILWVFGDSLSLAGIDQVYEQRTAAGAVAGAGIVYVLGFMSGAINPFLMVVGLSRRRPLLVGCALAGQLIVYSTLAGKVVLGSTLLTVATYFIFKNGRVMFLRVYAGILTLALLGPLVAKPRDLGLVSTLSDLVYMRILVLPGVLVGAYSDFFMRYPFTYLSHSLIGRPFSEYPYGKESVGQVIGRYVTPSTGAAVNNYNANFIAADGIAGFGTWGVPLIFLLTGGWLWLMSKLVGRDDRAVACAAIAPFVVSLADASLFTAILTGGGALVAVLLFLLRSSEQAPAVPSETAAGAHAGTGKITN